MDWDIREYDSIDSTNLEARRLLGGGAGAGLVVWARHQTAGRGRLERSWHDLPGKSLMASLALEGLDGFRAVMLACLSVRAAVRGGGGEGPLFKWPNDLVYGARKAGGVLCELCGAGGRRFVIAGLGLNVAYLPAELDFETRVPPTSLLIEEGRDFDVGALLRDVLDAFAGMMERSGDELLEEWRGLLVLRGEGIVVNPPYAVAGGSLRGTRRLEGRMEGVDGAGRLLLRVGGEVLTVASGDVEGGGDDVRQV